MTASAPSVVADTMQAGVTVMDPGVPEVNMQEGVTASVPTVAALKVHNVVHEALRPIRNEFNVGVPQTKTPIA